MGIFREFQAKASVKSLGFPSPLFSVWTMYVHNTDQRGNSPLWITVLLHFCDCNRRMIHCIFSKIRGKKKNNPTFWVFTGRVVLTLANCAYPAFQGHLFIVQYNDGNAEVVSMWVCRMLEERRSTQGPQWAGLAHSNTQQPRASDSLSIWIMSY